MVSTPDFSIKLENHVVKEEVNNEISKLSSVNKKKVLKTYIVNGPYELDHLFFMMHMQ